MKTTGMSSILHRTSYQSRYPLPSDSDGPVPERRPQRRPASLIWLRLFSERAAPRSFHLKIVQKPQHVWYAQQRAAAAPDAPVRCTVAWRGCRPRKIFTNNHESPYSDRRRLLWISYTCSSTQHVVQNLCGIEELLGWAHAARLRARSSPCTTLAVSRRTIEDKFLICVSQIIIIDSGRLQF